MYKHFDTLILALEELLKDPLSTSDTKSEFESLLKKVKRFEFIAFCCFWYSHLKQIDRVNKFLQKEDLTVDQAAKHTQGLLQFMKTSRDFSPQEALSEAKFIADSNNVVGEFKEKENGRKK